MLLPPLESCLVPRVSASQRVAEPLAGAGKSSKEEKLSLLHTFQVRRGRVLGHLL